MANENSKRPPLRARLFHCDVTSDELVLLLAMVEHCADGSAIYASISRLAAYSKLSERMVQRLIHGEDRDGKHSAGFCERGILTELAPGNRFRPGDRGKRRAATYRLNEAALDPDPKMVRYGTSQGELPGMARSAVTSEPQTGVRGTPVPCTSTGVRRTSRQVSGGQGSGVPRTPYPKAYDPKPLEIQHGQAALEAMPAWNAFKEQLRSELSAEEWDSWVRPMLLLKTMPCGEQTHILAALPPNGKIIQQAQNRVPLMRELLAPAGFNVSLTPYPDAWQIEESQRRYGVDMGPKPWTRSGGEV